VDPHVEFCGERYPLSTTGPLLVGRDGPLGLEDNPYLHRRFLEVSGVDSLWWLVNVGSSLTATVSDEAGLMQAWLAPGARLPLVFPRTTVFFTAGPTTYELDVVLADAPFLAVDAATPETGRTTLGRTVLTPDQALLVLALAEPVLRGSRRGSSAVPSSAEAALRLGWTMTKFNRKLDNVCEKLTRAGVRGLHGGPDRLATHRRARLVEHALAARVVTAADLDKLP
jgi:hypothetical protein